METVYNISVFTENSIGILNRITIIFTRRHLNIESITASESEVKGVYRYTIVVKTDLDQVKKVVAQIEKQVEVLKAFFHSDDQVVHQEIALYKIATESFVNGSTEKIVREHHARILTVDKEFTIIEKTGQPEELQALFNELDTYGVLEFVRSGRVAISKPMKTLETYLKELEA
ncbi:MAG: acetolactate synthase small subunit [Bacteroidetes bacterium]|nr:MAG: acetolactate synthase small subunit [Bacteroidota bacterium]